MEWKKSYKNRRGGKPRFVQRKQVDQKRVMKVAIERDASASGVFKAALTAFKKTAPDTVCEGDSWHLLYPDLRSEVVTLPCSTTSFTPERYSEHLNKGFSKIRLYLTHDNSFQGK